MSACSLFTLLQMHLTMRKHDGLHKVLCKIDLHTHVSGSNCLGLLVHDGVLLCCMHASNRSHIYVEQVSLLTMLTSVACKG